MGRILAAAILLWCSEASAAPFTITVESTGIEFNPAGEFSFLDSGIIDGFEFVGGAPLANQLFIIDDGGCIVGCGSGGSAAFAYEQTSTQPLMTMSQYTGVPFKLSSLQYGELVRAPFGPPGVVNAETIEVVGNLNGGGTLTRTLTLDQVVDGPGGSADFESHVFDATWAASVFDSVTFEGFNPGGTAAGFQLDDILVDVQGAHISVTTIDASTDPEFGTLYVEGESGSPVSLFQFLDTPAIPTRLTFDYDWVTNTGTFDVLLDGVLLKTFDSAFDLGGVFRGSLLVDGPLLGLTDAKLEFLLDGPAGSIIDIDNIVFPGSGIVNPQFAAGLFGWETDISPGGDIRLLSAFPGAIPEPSTCLLVLTGSVFLFRRRRRGVRRYDFKSNTYVKIKWIGD